MNQGPSFALFLFCAVLVPAAVGCSPARVVMRDANCGIVAIPSNSNMWPLKYRTHAEEKMAEHFPEGYVIDREEEVVVGQQTFYREDYDNRVREVAGFTVESDTAQGSTTTTDKTEYRIYYRRR